MATQFAFDEKTGQNYIILEDGTPQPITAEQAQRGELESAFQGASQSIEGIGLGAQELFGGDVEAEVADLRQRQDINSLLNPGSALAGSVAPEVAAGVGVGLATGGAGLVPMLAAEALLGGGIGFIQPGTMEERINRAAVGTVAGVLGGAGGRLAGRYLGGASTRRVAGEIGQASRQLEVGGAAARQADGAPTGQFGSAGAQLNQGGQIASGLDPMVFRSLDAGLELTPSQQTGSARSQFIEDVQSASPVLDSPLDSAREANELTVSNQIRKVFKLDDESGLLNPEDIELIDSRVQQNYDEAINKDATLKFAPNFEPPPSSVGAEVPVDELLAKYEKRFGAEGLTGQDYSTLRNSLSKDIRDLHTKGDSAVAEALETVRASIDSQAEAAGILNAQAKREADDVYELYLALRKTGIKSGGGVKVRSLVTRLRKNKGKFSQGGAANDDLERLNRQLEGIDFFASKTGNSGTAARLAGKALGPVGATALGVIGGGTLAGGN